MIFIVKIEFKTEVCYQMPVISVILFLVVSDQQKLLFNITPLVEIYKIQDF